ncbi:MAG: hypothetical protein E7076_04110 [Bacteroidales bacterium]|nr:hypothetical protein [Bacteroidales bacterium]
MKELVEKKVGKSERMQRQTSIFVNKIKQDIVWPQSLQGKIADFSSKDIVIVLSASPECYMNKLFLEINSNVVTPVLTVGSRFVNERYIEMYGKEKLKYITSTFPTSEYNYMYAVSDSESDLCWMELFLQHEIKKI